MYTLYMFDLHHSNAHKYFILFKSKYELYYSILQISLPLASFRSVCPNDLNGFSLWNQFRIFDKFKKSLINIYILSSYNSSHINFTIYVHFLLLTDRSVFIPCWYPFLTLYVTQKHKSSLLCVSVCVPARVEYSSWWDNFIYCYICNVCVLFKRMVF